MSSRRHSQPKICPILQLIPAPSAGSTTTNMVVPFPVSGRTANTNSGNYRTTIAVISSIDPMAKKTIKTRFIRKQYWPVTVGCWLRHAIKVSPPSTISLTRSPRKPSSPMDRLGHSTCTNWIRPHWITSFTPQIRKLTNAGARPKWNCSNRSIRTARLSAWTAT